ncbi:PREDICTED: AT-hook [Prunus dulcis]|uniref:AT-hook motif nuclear-localized protein n=1 Tax=Prunus dulcis TaxID=3755 RepID=A0A5E4G6Z6_PRUDU|nr:AT-hook motif nuclear-localized protein 1-like [Prunus dulcis]VVA35581.1 PREDICTED: AT-hook [Prunus dulcis]
MEEKESPFSGSPGNSGTESPPATQMVNIPMGMDVNMSSEIINNNGNNPVSTTTTTTTEIAEIAAAAATVGSGDLSGKKKRGRPRKYDADGNLRLGYNSNINKGGGVAPPPPPGFYLSSPASEFSSSSSSKRGRGRPPGSGNWQVLASLGELFANTAGGDFTPHVVTVSTGEDVAGKILSFSQKGPRGICVLSANGAVSNVTIRQPGSSGGILTYEGRFELLSLSGSFTVTEIGGVRNRTGGLSVSLAGPDGRVIGGGIAGLLTAASPIQIVVGSFTPNGYKAHKRKHYRENNVASPISGSLDTVTVATPISQAQPESESRLTTISPLPAQSHGEADRIMIQMQTSNAISTSAVWNGTELKSEHRPSPDINVSVPGVSVTGE